MRNCKDLFVHSWLYSIFAGLSALNRANYAQTGLYSYAFFSLSIGLERVLKLIFLIDHEIQTGTSPTNKELRIYGHNIEKLFEYVNSRYALFPAIISYGKELGEIEKNIIAFISKFADGTKYYNLD